MMKAHKLQQDEDLTFSSEKRAYPQKMTSLMQAGKSRDRLAPREVEVIRRSLDHLKVRSDRVEALKSQVSAGTYAVDSTRLAQKMTFLPLTRQILDNAYPTVLEAKEAELS